MSAIPKPVNEPILNFSPGSPERASLQAKLKELSAKEIEIPLIIGGTEVHTGAVSYTHLTLPTTPYV